MAEPELSGVHRTAFGPAVMRAWHLIGDGEPKVFVDSLGMALVGITEDQVRDVLSADSVPSTAIWVLRGRFTEDRLERARERGVEQYVILGAGLDTFALRHVNDLNKLVVFEVDDPPMQVWKQRWIAELGLPLPESLHFVPCDFETMSVGDALRPASFLPGSPAFVSWLGVTQYLTEDAIAQTLHWHGLLHLVARSCSRSCCPRRKRRRGSETRWRGCASKPSSPRRDHVTRE